MDAVLHVDMDEFIAAVEVLRRPELRGKPVVVGGDGDPTKCGVVSTANYEARKFGVHSAMPLRTAYALCPTAVFLPVDGAKYMAVSGEVMTILRRYTPLVEPISIDEAFLDVTGSAALFGDGEAIGRRIRADVASELGLTISVGVARTKLVAKVASDLRKPERLNELAVLCDFDPQTVAAAHNWFQLLEAIGAPCPNIFRAVDGSLRLVWGNDELHMSGIYVCFNPRESRP
jgi:DNA polymerase-4